jgi:mono/diheme cytochrome c family protein
MKYIISSFVILLVVLFSCNSSRNAELFSTDNLKTERFTIYTEQDTVLETPGGALLNIPKGSLSADGNSVTLEIKEAYTIADIIKASLTTTSNAIPLSSGGMIYINAKEKNVKINKALQVALPSNNLSREMLLYKGEVNAGGKINWIDPKALPENKQLSAIEKGKALFQTNCTSCHAIESKIVGPPLANFLKRFPLTEDRDENYWGYRAHPYMGLLPRRSGETKIDSSWIYDADIMRRSRTDTSKKIPANRMRELTWLQWYECNMHNYSPADGPAFNLTSKELENIYKYIQSESDKLNIPYSEGTAYENDRCFDSCQIYNKRMNLLNKLKTVEQDKREKFIEENGEMTNVIPDPTWIPVPPPPVDFSWKVSPNNYKSTYYQFTVETFGWYNIDMLLAENKEEVKESELFVKLAGDWKDRINIFLIIPSYNVYGEGGPADRNPAEFAFFNKNGSIPLPQNAKAYILAVSEKDDKIGYALKEFTTGLKQELEVEVRESTKEEFDKAIASLGVKQMSVIVKPSLNADSIRAAAKKLKDIDKGLKDAEQLKPKNCNCNCSEGSDLLITKPIAAPSKK